MSLLFVIIFRNLGNVAGLKSKVTINYSIAGISSYTQVFNTEYYKTLAARPAHVKDKYCVGKLDDSKATKEWYVKNLQFEYYWKQEETKWIDRPRRLLWNHFATRGPVCEAAEEDKLGKGDIFWNVKELDAKVKKEGKAFCSSNNAKNKKTFNF